MRTELPATVVAILLVGCSSVSERERGRQASVTRAVETLPTGAIGSASPGTGVRPAGLAPVASQDCLLEACRVISADGPRPEILKRVTAEYPREAAEQGIGGEVDVVASIDRSGTVVSACRASGPEAFWRSSEAAMRKWRFAAREWPSGCVRMVVRFSYRPEKR